MLVPLETSLVPGGKSDNRWSCQSVLQAGSSSGLHICGAVSYTHLDVYKRQQTAKIKLDLGKTCQCTEWLLNVSYKLKNREGLLSAGHVVAKDQLTLSPSDLTSLGPMMSKTITSFSPFFLSLIHI